MFALLACYVLKTHRFATLHSLHQDSTTATQPNLKLYFDLCKIWAGKCVNPGITSQLEGPVYCNIFSFFISNTNFAVTETSTMSFTSIALAIIFIINWKVFSRNAALWACAQSNSWKISIKWKSLLLLLFLYIYFCGAKLIWNEPTIFKFSPMLCGFSRSLNCKYHAYYHDIGKVFNFKSPTADHINMYPRI